MSEIDVYKPLVFTENSFFSVCIIPAGNSKFACAIVSETSCKVIFFFFF